MCVCDRTRMAHKRTVILSPVVMTTTTIEVITRAEVCNDNTQYFNRSYGVW